jgi:fatty-acid desaturase
MKAEGQQPAGSLSRRLTGAALIGIHIGALAIFWPGFFAWPALATGAAIAYCTGALGITLCFHRTLTHRSLRLRKPLEYLLAVFGTLSLQGDPIRWVAVHRKHHAHADHDGDPHTIQRGFWWAHFDWLYRNNVAMPTDDEIRRYAPDLYAEPFYRALAWLALPLQLALGVALFLIGGWPFVVWGMFGRLVFAYHSTWFVNSAAHMLGYRTFRTNDESTNCWWVALLSFGEGWHNNHHAFPFSARHGLKWYELDLTWWQIRLLQVVRLADRIKVPTEAMQRKMQVAPMQRDLRNAG